MTDVNIRTTEQIEAALATNEPVSALIVGTSSYPHAVEADLAPERRHYAVKPLTSAAHSASWFASWLSAQWSRRDQIVDLQLLLSPAPDESIHHEVAAAWAAAGSPAATLANFQAAFEQLRARTEGGKAMAVVYLAGHGVQVSGRSATVLLNDYLAPDQTDIYEAAIDSMGCHAALSDGRYANTQFWFVDSCRESSNVEREFEVLSPGWSPRDRAKGAAEVSPVFLASSPWTTAFAQSYGRSLFSKALGWALDGNAASRIPGSDEGWGVLTGDLVNQLGPKVKELAAEHQLEQRVEPTGTINYAVVHELGAIRSGSQESLPGEDLPTSNLRIDADVGSWHLRSITPFSVTDDDGTVVAEAIGPQTLEVPVGRYKVSMRQPDGIWATNDAEVEAGDDTAVRFDFVFPTTSNEEVAAGADTEDVELLRVEEAEGLSTGNGAWTFVPQAGEPPRVPRATFRVGGRTMIVSLPVNPTLGFPENACVVTVDEAIGVRAAFAPERKVSTALQAILERESIGSGIDLFQQSSDLLVAKYQEPVGATLGGLTLHRIGHLPDRAAWVANLARGFAWLPDALGLQAALLSTSDDDATRSEGLQLLLDASEHRPMFTDGLALIVDLLQRWPTAERREDRLEHLGFAAPILTKAVPSSILLLTDHGEQR